MNRRVRPGLPDSCPRRGFGTGGPGRFQAFGRRIPQPVGRPAGTALLSRGAIGQIVGATQIKNPLDQFLRHAPVVGLGAGGHFLTEQHHGGDARTWRIGQDTFPVGPNVTERDVQKLLIAGRDHLLASGDEVGEAGRWHEVFVQDVGAGGVAIVKRCHLRVEKRVARHLSAVDAGGHPRFQPPPQALAGFVHQLRSEHPRLGPFDEARIADGGQIQLIALFPEGDHQGFFEKVLTVQFQPAIGHVHIAGFDGTDEEGREIAGGHALERGH